MNKKYLTVPNEIEDESMRIIESEMIKHDLDPYELPVIKRMIHTTGDFDYQSIVRIKSGSIKAGMEAIKEGCLIVTDTKMAFSGINKKLIEKHQCQLENYITHPEVVQNALDQGTTRSIASMDFAARKKVGIFVIGNAPTALFRLGELLEQKKIAPKLIIGVPVGFVGASESKEYIRSLEISSISTQGRKGGSAVAAAILNAILLQIKTD